MSGHPAEAKREMLEEGVFLKLHEVVEAIELCAAVTGQVSVHSAAHEARHEMDATQAST